MPSLSSQWKDTKRAWNDSQSSDSPGARFGLMFDPLAYILGDKYRNFIKKTGDESNKTLAHAIGSDDSNSWVGNKPASTIGLIIGGSYAGGGMFGGGGSGPSGGDLGVFSHGGSGGMSPVGGGNAGVLANSGGIEGGAGVGGMGGGSMMGKQMPQMPGQQQQQSKNTFLQDELERQAKERELKKQIADELGPRYV